LYAYAYLKRKDTCWGIQEKELGHKLL